MSEVPVQSDTLDAERVPVARSVRLRRLRVKALPVACLLASAIAWLALWQSHSESIRGIGRVSTLRIDITSPASGLIARMPHNTRLQWSLFDHVREGDVIAEYDSSEWLAGKQQFEYDAAALDRELVTWQEYYSRDVSEKLADQLKKMQQDESAAIVRLNEQVQQGAAAERVADVDSLEAPSFPGELSASAREHFTELRNDRYLLAIRRIQLRNQADTLFVRAPISGTLVDVFCSPGQRLHAGAPIATLAADHGSYIVSYLPEATRFEPLPGMKVTLRSRTGGTKPIESEIEEVGRQIETIPSSLAVNPSFTERGLPIRIALPLEIDMQPEALVEVVYHAANL